MALIKLPSGTTTGLSTDAKPAAGIASNPKSGTNYAPAPRAGDRFVETDTGQAYLFTGQDWRTVQ